MRTALTKVLLLCLLAAAPPPAAPGEAAVDAHGNVAMTPDDDGDDATAGVASDDDYDDDVLAADAQVVLAVRNESPYRVDVYYDDGEYGSLITTLEQGERGGVNSFPGHRFFVTRHGVKEGLFSAPGTPEETRLVFDVAARRDQVFVVPADAGPSRNPCQDRFGVCRRQAANGACERSPGWMIVHCCESCDPYLNSSELIDPAKRCSKEQLNTPEPSWKPGDLNKLFTSWATDPKMKELGLEVISAPEPVKYGATSDKAKEGGPWVVVFNDFLSDAEVADLIKGGEMEGYDRSTDQGASNELGEMEKVVSKTRTSANAWCMHKCERLPGVQSATKKIEDVTGIPRVNYESFQLLQYQKGQFYRRHHDSSQRDATPAGHRILTFFLYLTDVEEGGETYFNKLDIAIKPKKGRALVWPSVLDSDPEFWDARMYHEARDVIKGQKMAANHWIHLNDYHTPNNWGCTGSFT